MPKLPSHLYKYRPPSIDRLQTILIEDELWAADPTTFNDPFDCSPYIDPRCTHQEAKSWISEACHRGGISLSRRERQKLARQFAKTGVYSPKINGSHSNEWTDIIKQFGVLSFAQNATNILMWSHYAENHTGVCLEFSTLDDPFNRAVAVHYTHQRPVYRPVDPNRNELAERVLLHKADIWSYEKEWRYVQFRDGPGRVQLPHSALTSIILGALVSPRFAQAVTDLVKNAASRLILSVR